jgi:hypothetical protein
VEVVHVASDGCERTSVYADHLWRREGRLYRIRFHGLELTVGVGEVEAVVDHLRWFEGGVA